MLAFPLPAQVISELLGVPHADREHFGRLSARVGVLDNVEVTRAVMAEFIEYTHWLAAATAAVIE